MNKIIAEIIASVVPGRRRRNLLRGKLRFGLSNIAKLRRELSANTTEPTVNLAVCVIAKNEGDYLKEWLDWHITRGVDKFYFYDNGSTDNTVAILEPYVSKGIVEYISFPGYRRQLAAYDDCLARHRYDTRWIAFIDIDEFIVPAASNTLLRFLKEHDSASAIEINWLIYGSGGLQEKTPDGVMQRFRRHAPLSHPLNRYVKSIVNPRKVSNMIGCHEAAILEGHAVDGNGRKIEKSFKDRQPVHETFRVNHYAVKSLQEFTEKQSRGRASGRQRSIGLEYFHRFDLNDLEDQE